MKKIILKIIVIILRIIYVPFSLLKVQDKVTYISRQSNKENLDFKLIRQEMEKMYPNTKNVVLTKMIEKGPISKLSYVGHMLVQMYHLSTSKVIILDTYCIVACVLKHKKQTKIIQIWHALSAVKKFGYQTIGTETGTDKITAEIMCMHKNYDYVLAPSKITAKYYKEAFDVDDDKIVYLGMPRIDYLMQENKEIKEKIYNQYPVLKEKINILYVPTFRKKEKIKLDELVEKIDTGKFNLIIKIHPLDIQSYRYLKKDGVIYDNSFSTYDLLKIADKVITDYSSLAMDVALLDKPIYFYAYDIDEYKKAPGLNFNFDKEEIGKYKFEDINELLENFGKEYDREALKRFKEKYISVPTTECTKKIINFMMEENNE